ncbi:IclR family transcriptional regulator [Patulibacter sp. NPDC049589]|uniref:IclR family transcriptional regulator n=1 Tax=Patulibacter sp. NPDC049589 TaxID=3154731 RepID=UPI00344453CA
MDAKDRSDNRGVESVARALDILEHLSDGPRRLSDLARDTGLRPSTTHRLLDTLARSGHVRRLASGEYGMGVRAARLGDRAAAGVAQFTETVAPFVGRVHRVSRQTTNLFAVDDISALLIDQIGDADVGSFNVEVGARLPSHATASGKLSLAYAGRKTVAKLRRTDAFERYTPNTITNVDDLLAEVAVIRQRGFATSDCEYGQLTHGIASPLFDASGGVVGALGISVLTAVPERLARDIAEEFGELISCAAAEASAALGYEGPSHWAYATA